MSSLQQSIRDNLLYVYGYLQGRSFNIPHSPSQLYALSISKVTSFISLPLPFLSFLALPFYGGTSTTINLLFFYLVWSAFVASHDPLTVELGGTLLVRLVFFLLPALGFLAFDCALPNLSKGLKAKGQRQLPLNLGQNKLLEVIGVAIINVLLSVALQGGLELLATRALHLRSLLKVTGAVPLPWSIATDVLRGLVVRGILHYSVHRFLLHGSAQPFTYWHKRWQHSVQFPFSLVAAYDHPVDHLLGQFLPTFLPAYLFRFHVLTWHLFLALVSMEELFVFSGYAVLPSSIVLAGMARRTDAHFEVVHADKGAGNFGHLGVLDFLCGTTCKDEVDVLDDIQSEAVKHRIQQRAEDAVQGAMSGIKGKQDQDVIEAHAEDDVQDEAKEEQVNDEPAADADDEPTEDTDVNASSAIDGKAENGQLTQRRSGRRRKA